MDNEPTSGIPFKATLSVQVGVYKKDFEVSQSLNPNCYDSAKNAAEKIREMANCAAAPTTAFYDAIVALNRAKGFSENA